MAVDLLQQMRLISAKEQSSGLFREIQGFLYNSFFFN